LKITENRRHKGNGYQRIRDCQSSISLKVDGRAMSVFLLFCCTFLVHYCTTVRNKSVTGIAAVSGPQILGIRTPRRRRALVVRAASTGTPWRAFPRSRNVKELLEKAYPGGRGSAQAKKGDGCWRHAEKNNFRLAWTCGGADCYTRILFALIYSCATGADTCIQITSQ